MRCSVCTSDWVSGVVTRDRGTDLDPSGYGPLITIAGTYAEE
jgi:hypothetical protein